MEGDLGQQELGVNAHQLPIAVVQVPLRREGPGSGSLPGHVPRTPEDPACGSAGQGADQPRATPPPTARHYASAGAARPAWATSSPKASANALEPAARSPVFLNLLLVILAKETL